MRCKDPVISPHMAFDRTSDVVCVILVNNIDTEQAVAIRDETRYIPGDQAWGVVVRACEVPRY